MTAAAALTGGGDGTTSAASAVVPPAASTVVATDPNAGTQPAQVDTKWLGDDAPEDLRGYVQNKGWKHPREVLEGYRNLEKVVGTARLAMPKDENDVEGYNKVYDALGRPKSAAEYKLPVPEGADPAFAKAASEVFHKAGVTSKQASAVATWWNEQMGNAQKAAEEKYLAESDAAMQKLEATWGSAYQERMETTKRAVRQFGIDATTADAMERALGTEKFMDFMWRVGHAISEHGAGAGLEQPGTGSGALTPEQAKAEIARLKGDREWAKKYANGGAEESRRMQQLHKWAFPGA
jgi:hypothetical protein